MIDYLVHNIGHTRHANYSIPDKVKMVRESSLARLTFDGVYLNVWTHRHLLRNCKHKPILYIMGDFVGKDNNFDSPQPLELFCDWNQIFDLALNYNCELGWHTWCHRNLTELTDAEVLREVTPPFKMKYFAYPYGNVDKRVENIVKSVGCYEEAHSVFQGNGSQLQKNRKYL